MVASKGRRICSWLIAFLTLAAAGCVRYLERPGCQPVIMATLDGQGRVASADTLDLCPRPRPQLQGIKA